MTCLGVLEYRMIRSDANETGLIEGERIEIEIKMKKGGRRKEE